MRLSRFLISVLAANIMVFSPAYTFANDQPVFGTWEEVFFKVEYARFKPNKALAIGPNGYVYYADGHASPEQARRAAMAGCDEDVTKLRKEKKPAGWCLPYAVNDEIVWKGLSPGISSDKELPAPDLPFIQGQLYGYSPDARGILLMLHGCDRPTNPPHIITMTWINYFLARGFYVVMPDSFADKRPELCGEEAWFRDYAVTMEVERLRVAQTKRTLRELRKLHPQIPIYIWGHSGGARTVQSFAPDVEGVIASGDECGLGFMGSVIIPPTVPVLYIFGETDPYLEEFGKTVTEKAVKKRCRSRGNRKWVIVEEIGHDVAIWHQNVIDAVSNLIGEDTFNLDYERTSGELSSGAKTAFENDYKKTAGYRAFAVADGGDYGYSYNWNSEKDAVQHALQLCENYIGKTAYAPGGAHTCKIYDIGKK